LNNKSTAKRQHRFACGPGSSCGHDYGVRSTGTRSGLVAKSQRIVLALLDRAPFAAVMVSFGKESDQGKRKHLHRWTIASQRCIRMEFASSVPKQLGLDMGFDCRLVSGFSFRKKKAINLSRYSLFVLLRCVHHDNQIPQLGSSLFTDVILEIRTTSIIRFDYPVRDGSNSSIASRIASIATFQIRATKC
jgi:hypothetical protein